MTYLFLKNTFSPYWDLNLAPKMPFSCTLMFDTRLHHFWTAKFFPKMYFLFGPSPKNV